MITATPDLDNFLYRSQPEYSGGGSDGIIARNRWCNDNFGERNNTWCLDYQIDGQLRWCFKSESDFVMFVLTW